MSTQAVGSTNTATNSTSASGTSGTNTLSQNNFLQLLMTQLKNQNPLDPTDTNQMVTEMSELTSVQAITGMATDIGNLTSYHAGRGRRAMDIVHRGLHAGEHHIRLSGRVRYAVPDREL